jgi:nitroreductase
MSIKQNIRKLLPESIYRQLRFSKRAPNILKNALHDLTRYIKFSSVVNYADDEDKLRAIITATYHNIEKGLSLPEPRLGFGKANLSRLIGYIDECLQRYGSRQYLTIPISVIGAYIDYHEQHDYDVAVLRTTYTRLAAQNTPTISAYGIGGIRTINRDDILASVTPVTIDFFEQRYSCRQFSDEPVTPTEIETAVRVAQKSPAVCNRQSGRIYTFNAPKDIEKILALQGGARGFSQGVKVLFCVVVDIRNFGGIGERYQGWIDGGLFAMSFIYGLHMQGIGSCCLNWSKDDDQDNAVRDLINIAEHETIIMFIAAGHLLQNFVVAKSIRKPISEVMESGHIKAHQQ